jgi:hypothetical protein
VATTTSEPRINFDYDHMFFKPSPLWSLSWSLLASHKRSIYPACCLIAGNFLLALACCYALLAVLAFYDWRSTGKVQWATLLGSVTVIASEPPVAALFTHNAVWSRVATQMLALGRFLH